MITRIVKLTMRDTSRKDFEIFVNTIKESIRGFEGCRDLEILQDIHNKNVFFTHSLWDSEEALDSYRQSDFFKRIWPSALRLFGDQPQAWTLERV